MCEYSRLECRLTYLLTRLLQSLVPRLITPRGVVLRVPEVMDSLIQVHREVPLRRGEISLGQLEESRVARENFLGEDIAFYTRINYCCHSTTL